MNGVSENKPFGKVHAMSHCTCVCHDPRRRHLGMLVLMQNVLLHEKEKEWVKNKIEEFTEKN